MTGSVRQRARRGARRTFALASLALLLAASGVGVPTPSADATPTSAAYVPVAPYRLADTRLDPCGCTRVDASTITVDVAGRAGVPPEVVAAAVTITATETSVPGFVTVYPDGAPRPLASTLNTRSDRPVANSTVVQVGGDGRISLYQHVPGHLIVDITGAFVPTDATSAGRYVPVSSRRLVDTRLAAPDGVPLPAGGELTVPLPAEVADDAIALVVNVTSVGESSPGYLSARPAGSEPAVTSFVNMNGSGQAVAAAAIIPVSPVGLTITSFSGGHVIVDLLGWFTGPSAPASDVGLFVPLGPQRLLDTRETPPRIWPGGTIELAVPYSGAGSLVTNVTATFADRIGFISAFPAGTPRPGTSTLNPALHDHTLANLAITQLSDRGLAYYGHAGSDLVVDVTGMFTGSPITASEPPEPNLPRRSRVLMVGDSTLASVPLYSQAQSAFIGFDAIVDAESCRRLLKPSCLSDVTHRTPNTAVEAILGTPGDLAIVVVKAGYNDWFSDFPTELDAVVRAARHKGAHTIIWLSYSDDVTRPTARRAYQENNVDLFHLVTLPQYSDVLLADWRAYTAGATGWTWDGTHLTEYGTWLITDYLSRWTAAVEHRPCPQPWGPGGPVFAPCPKPDTVGVVPDVRALY